MRKLSKYHCQCCRQCHPISSRILILSFMTRIILCMLSFSATVLIGIQLSSCRVDRQADLCAKDALQKVDELYYDNKTICDSLLDVAISYYLPNLAKGDTSLSSLTSSSQQAECMLFEGIRHHDRAQELKPDMDAYTAEMTKAYRLFLEVERNVKLLPNPYLKGVVNDRIAIINMRNGNYSLASTFFRKVLQNAYQVGDTTDIALSYMHLAYSFYKLGNGDSALYYSDKALFLAPHLPKRELAALYANSAHLHHFFGLADENGDFLLSQIRFEECTRNDSCRIYAIMVDYYQERKRFAEADSLSNWIIAHSDDKPELLSLAYLRRSKQFEQLGMLDSALTYRKALAAQQKIERQSKLGTEFAEAHGQYQKVQQQRHYEHIVIVIVVIALLVILIILILWMRRIQRVKQLEQRISGITAKMNQQMAESQDKEEKWKQQYKTTVTTNQSLHVQIEYMLRRFILLDLNASWPSSIFEELLSIYRGSNAKRRHLIDELNKLSLTPRHKAICLLISEHKHDPKQLWYYAGCANEAAFRATKSQIKQKLLTAAPSSPEIQSLLKCFNVERGCPEKPMPNVKSDGKK